MNIRGIGPELEELNKLKQELQAMRRGKESSAYFGKSSEARKPVPRRARFDSDSEREELTDRDMKSSVYDEIVDELFEIRELLESKNQELREREEELYDKEEELTRREHEEFTQREDELIKTVEHELFQRESELLKREEEMKEYRDKLDRRNREIKAREEEVSRREREMKKKEDDFYDMLESDAAKFTNEAIKIAKQEVNKHIKRLNQMERAVSDKILIVKTKQQILTQSKSSSLMSSRASEPAAKLKARIVALERSNEHMKAKLQTSESELKAEKQNTAKLTEELGRIKARCAMLEQSLQALRNRQEEEEQPPTLVKLPEVKEDPQSHSIKLTDEITLFFKSLNSVLKSMRLTLPLYSGSAQSLGTSRISGYTGNTGKSGISTITRLSTIEELSSISLGELLYPNFNNLIPSLIEMLPFLNKLKNAEIQATLLQTIWEMLTFAYFQNPGDLERDYRPEYLQFDPVTECWKRRISKIRNKGTIPPAYPIFESLYVHKAMGFYLGKLSELTSNKKERVYTCILSSLILLITTTSEKKLGKTLLYLKSLLTEHETSDIAIQCMLCDVNWTVPSILITVKERNVNLKQLATELLLALTINSQHSSRFLAQISHPLCLSIFLDILKFSVKRGISEYRIEEIEENCIILLQKISTQQNLKRRVKETDIPELLTQRAKSADTQGNEFFMSNLHSILRNLS